MAHYLVIVESPAKAKTINRFLGKNYTVVASNGHVRDLPKSQLGIDVDNDFEPKYITIRGKGEILSMLRKEAKKRYREIVNATPSIGSYRDNSLKKNLTGGMVWIARQVCQPWRM